MVISLRLQKVARRDDFNSGGRFEVTEFRSFRVAPRNRTRFCGGAEQETRGIFGKTVAFTKKAGAIAGELAGHKEHI